MSIEPLYYSGVGSRRTTDQVVLALMTSIAQALGKRGYILRSGAAPGPDTAFERGAPRHLRHIYIPNEGFCDRPGMIVPKKVNLMRWLKACSIAEQFHGLGRRMPQDVRELMGRNVYQVLGDDLATPSKFLICDAPFPVFDDQGRVVDVDGGTGMAVRLAAAHDIPIYHLGVAEHRRRMEQFVEQSMTGLEAEPVNARTPRP